MLLMLYEVADVVGPATVDAGLGHGSNGGNTAGGAVGTIVAGRVGHVAAAEPSAAAAAHGFAPSSVTAPGITPSAPAR